MCPLKQAVLSSSSDQPLADLMSCVRHVDGVRRFEVFLLRDTDTWEMEKLGYQLKPERPLICPDDRKPSEILAIDANLDILYEWITNSFEKANRKVPPKKPRCTLSGFATFFPDITSLSQEHPSKELPDLTPREIAVKALVNTLKLAKRIKDEKPELLAESCDGRQAIIVEAVCGTVTDRCTCPKCVELQRKNEVDFSTITTPERKIELLCQSLDEVQQAFNPPDGHAEDWAISLEVEPGPAYLLNNGERIKQLFEAIDHTKSNNGHLLANHVGLNVDVAHARIAGIKVESDSEAPGESLRDHIHRIVHAHICDNPKMHTRDQPIGNWHTTEYDSEEWNPFLDLLSDTAKQISARKVKLPFSRTVSLELEGCDRLQWIHQSLSNLRRLFYERK